jgi:hypothetical protein
MKDTGIKNELLNAARQARLEIAIAEGKHGRIDPRDVAKVVLNKHKDDLIERALKEEPLLFPTAAAVGLWIEAELAKST